MDFDPYYKWLAIPPTEQPPNYYRLLGVPLFTADPDVIENAADQRMAHLRSFQTGRHAQDSQRLLNEVATARVCLLNATKRSEYDATLRRTMPTAMPVQPAYSQQQPAVQPVYLQQQPPAQPSPPPVPPPLGATSAPLTSPSREVTKSPTLHARPPRRKPASSPLVEVFKHVAASIAGLLIGYLLIGFFAPSWDHFHLFHPQPVAVNPAPVPPESVEPVTTPAKVEPVRPKPAVVKPPLKQNETPSKAPTIKPMPAPPPPPPMPTAEELAQRAEEEKQERLKKLQTDRDAAVAAGKVVEALKLTGEYAELRGLDPRAEEMRVIAELRKADHPPAETFILTSDILEQARHSLENDQRPLAIEQATAALQLARKTTDQDLIRQATKLILEIQQQE